MTRPPLDQGVTSGIGPYRLAHRIAVGGMAEVYRALSAQTAGEDRAVVIKRLLPALADDPLQRRMFDLEARLGLRIAHPNVVAVLDRGMHDGAPYIVLEYVFGVDLFRLARYLRHHGQTLDPELAIWLGCELLAGLDAVHRATDEAGAPLDIVHRDVSPANVFLSVHGDVKLGDLGIARAAAGREAAPSVRAKGKLGYLPPEQVAGREVDQRGDVYSAAVVIAELLIGRPLFASATEIGVLLAIRDGEIGPFKAIAQYLPADVAAALSSALERRPQDRMSTSVALLEKLCLAVKKRPAALRRELGALVVAALDHVTPARDETSLAATLERDASSFETATPVTSTEMDGLRESGPVYRVERDGGILGVFTLAALVRAMTTGEVRATDTVRGEEGERRSVAEVAELSPHLPPSARTPEVRRRMQMAETSEVYDLGRRSMLSVLTEMLSGRERGLLLCEQGGVRKEIYLAGGVPVFVTSNQPGELLGEVLVRRGVVDRTELDLALAVMPRFEGRLGETLLALGLTDAMTLFRSIAEQVRDRVLEPFTWSAGHASLYRGVEPPARAFPLELDALELLVEGGRRRVRAGLEDAAFAASEGAVLVRGLGDARLLAGAELLEELMQACEGPRTLVELEGRGVERARVRAAVLVLTELDLLRWRRLTP